jgi:tetratricopeptide (TPR) repeat protein
MKIKLSALSLLLFSFFALIPAASGKLTLPHSHHAGSSSNITSFRFVTDQERDALSEELSQAYQEVLAQSQENNMSVLIAKKEEHEKNQKYTQACQGYLCAAFCLPIDDEQQQKDMLSKAHTIYDFKLNQKFSDYKKYLMACSALGNKEALNLLFTFYYRNKQNQKAEVVCDISNSKFAYRVLADDLSNILVDRPNKIDKLLLAKFEYYATRAESYRTLGWTYNALTNRRLNSSESMRFNQKAIESYQKALEAGDQYAAIPLSNLYKRQHNDQKVLEVLEQGAKLGNDECAHELAVYQQPDIQLALSSAHKAVELNDSAYNKKYLAELYIKNNDLDNAEKYLIEAANQHSNYMLQLGDFFRDLRHLYPKAEECYQERLRENWRCTDAYERLGKLYEYSLKDLNKAEKIILKELCCIRCI